MVKYDPRDFDRWFNEPESYGLRSERLFYLLQNQPDELERFKLITRWMRAAFEYGRNSG
jgi:hypothetical protein